METENSDIQQHSPISSNETGSSHLNLLVTPEEDPGQPIQWIPSCSNDIKPAKGMIFKTLNDGISFYKKYGHTVGFNIRKSTRRSKNDIVYRQKILCNRAGYKEDRNKQSERISNIEDTETGLRKTQRKRLDTRVGCKARIILKHCRDGTYMITDFIEAHTHTLYTPGCAKYQKGHRKLSIIHKKMIVKNAQMNVGPVTTFRLMKQATGGYDNVGAAKQDFKNYQRDLKTIMKDSDGQMFVDYHTTQKRENPGYFFEYELDEEDHLCRAFWADPMGKKNYALYGDMVSFDTTYQTNRYSMIFGPFTGIDNHKRCVTFCSCLVANEDTASFEWVFRTFIKTMSNKEPTCIITDQDGAIRNAVLSVFEMAEHRYCMWHITKKMNEKVGKGFDRYDEFRLKLDAFIWSLEMEPAEFEAGWREVISEFELQNHEWLTHLYAIKELWIPAYFRDLYLGGLMKTTSLSESENSFFNRFTRSTIALAEFILRYNNAIDAQRHEQGQFDNDAKNKKVTCNTPMIIEKHAADVYTPSMFYEIQREIHIACFYCGLQDLRKENELDIFTVTHRGKPRTFEVSYNCNNNETNCSCKTFQRQGTPCAHMIWVWKMKMIEKIPEMYVLNRWTILAATKQIIDLQGNVLEQPASTSKNDMVNDLWSEMMMCVNLAEIDEQNLCDLLNSIKELRQGLESKRNEQADMDTDSSNSKSKEMEKLIGMTQPTEIRVKQPKISKTKGSGLQLRGKERRLKSIREKMIEKSKTKPRKCNTCKQEGDHDSRNCPTKQK